jgi:hypothetical protein
VYCSRCGQKDVSPAGPHLCASYPSYVGAPPPVKVDHGRGPTIREVTERAFERHTHPQEYIERLEVALEGQRLLVKSLREQVEPLQLRVAGLERDANFCRLGMTSAQAEVQRLTRIIQQGHDTVIACARSLDATPPQESSYEADDE